MAEKEISRRLVAILAADIAGYTRLMEQDTDGTVAAWHEARSEVIDPAIARFSGRIVKHTGDGFLAEYATAQDAVNCAIAMQNELAASPLEFRMGVNLGDVIDDGEDIHGEGVNLAARLEGLADPGSICLSGLVYEAVRNRIEAPFEDLGDKTVKHVSAPLRVWRIGRPGGSEVRESATALPDDLQQEIRFCQAADGVTIAYATVGDGPPWSRRPTGCITSNTTGKARSGATCCEPLPGTTPWCASTSAATASPTGTRHYRFRQHGRRPGVGDRGHRPRALSALWHFARL